MYFRPLPQGQGSFLRILAVATPGLAFGVAFADPKADAKSPSEPFLDVGAVGVTFDSTFEVKLV